MRTDSASRYTSLWHSLKGRRRFAFYALHYTAVFLIICFFVFRSFSRAGVSFVWNSDGRGQHLARLLYLSKTFREALTSLLSGDGWTFPLYDFRSAYTAIDLQIGFPQILAILFPPDKIDVFYNLLVLSGYYMSGLTFSVLGFYFRRRPPAVLAGAISYAFCGFVLFTGVRHPHFIVAMWFLPLLVIGAEKVLRGKSWLLLVMVFLSLTTQWGLYFSCMQAVILVMYITVRFFDYYKTDRVREYLRLWGRLFVWGGTGALLACMVAVPSFYAIIGTGRVGRDITAFRNLLHYNKDYYLSFLNFFMVSPSVVGDWTILGFSAVSVPAVLWLFTKRGRPYRALRILFVLLTLMLWVPAVGYTLSGLSNISNRFCFAYALCVCSAITFLFPDPGELQFRDLVLPGIWLVVYAALPFIDRTPIPGFRYILMVYALLYGVLLFGTLAGRLGRKLLRPGLILVTCVSVCLSGTLRYSPDFENYVAEFIASPLELSAREQYASLAQSRAVREDTGFFRVGGSNVAYQELNMAFYYDLNGMTMYPYFGWSEDYLDWLRENEYTFYKNKQHLYGVGPDAWLLTLAGNKYYALRSGGKKPVPYGYSSVETIENGRYTEEILRNDNALPLGYTYDRYMAREDYLLMDPLDRQENMMRAVVLDNAPERVSVERAKPVLSAERIPYTVEETDGLTWENGILTVKKAGATIRLTFEGKAKAETWLRILDLDLTRGSSSRRWTLTTTAENVTTYADFAADGYVYANLMHTQMLPLGYSEDGLSQVMLSFPEKGTFLLRDLEIWCQSMDALAREASALRQEPLRDIRTNWRGLHGSVKVSGDKILCLSLPWLDGWSAYLDGEKAPLLHANTAFMAIEVPAGEHEVELRYMLPGLLPGLGLSLAGLVCLFVLLRGQRRSRSK